MRLRGKKGARETLEQYEQDGSVVLNPQKYKGKWHEFFGNDRPIHIELGMGKGKFIAEISARYEEVNYIGIDKYDELILRAHEKAYGPAAEDIENRQAQNPRRNNLALVLFNIENIENIFAQDEVNRIYLHFSDPWPKLRHARRRLTYSRFLEKYGHILNSWGDIHMKTDSLPLFEFSLNSFADFGFRLRHISLDLYREGPREDQIMTEYEQKFVEQGMRIYRCEAVVGHELLAELDKDQTSGSPA